VAVIPSFGASSSCRKGLMLHTGLWSCPPYTSGGRHQDTHHDDVPVYSALPHAPRGCPRILSVAARTTVMAVVLTMEAAQALRVSERGDTTLSPSKYGAHVYSAMICGVTGKGGGEASPANHYLAVRIKGCHWWRVRGSIAETTVM
jgi:hypothetical protein